MAGDIVNLNKVRKSKARDEKDRQADVNRTKFGRDKAERAHDAEAEKRRALILDGAKLLTKPTQGGGATGISAANPKPKT
jgi:Domain of unknown function (DUF4169)